MNEKVFSFQTPPSFDFSGEFEKKYFEDAKFTLLFLLS
jgi:hypothetical protein